MNLKSHLMHNVTFEIQAKDKNSLVTVFCQIIFFCFMLNGFYSYLHFAYIIFLTTSHITQM